MRYYVNDAGGWLTVSGDAATLSVVPPEYREVTEPEFNEASGAIILSAPPTAPLTEGGTAEARERAAPVQAALGSVRYDPVLFPSHS